MTKRKTSETGILISSFAISILFVAGLFFAYQADYIEPSNFKSILYAFLITTLNYILGLLSIKIGIEKSAKTFIISFLGGMIFRLALMLGLILISLDSLEIKQDSFIFSVFIFYSLYLISEIIYLNNRKS